MSKRGIWFVVVLLALLSPSTTSWAADRPWERDLALLDRAYADLNAGSILAMEAYADEVEAALKQAPALFEGPVLDGGEASILTDGQGETLAALVMARGQVEGDVAAFRNPYPILALHLGTFYAEVGRFKDALRVLNAGVALSPVPDLMLGDTVPSLLAERGFVLSNLGRWDDAMANYDTGIAIAQMSNQERARLHRGRGYVLIEMGELDEAEAAYRTSLELEPGNQNALSELGYIESIR